MIKRCFSPFQFQSIFFHLPPSENEQSWLFPQTIRWYGWDVWRVSALWQEPKRGWGWGESIIFRLIQKSAVQHENLVLIFVLGLLRSFATKLKSISSISKLQTYGEWKAHGWQCVSLLFRSTHQGKPNKRLCLWPTSCQPLGQQALSGEQSFSDWKKQDKIELFLKFYTYKAGKCFKIKAFLLQRHTTYKDTHSGNNSSKQAQYVEMEEGE